MLTRHDLRGTSFYRAIMAAVIAFTLVCVPYSREAISNPTNYLLNLLLFVGRLNNISKQFYNYPGQQKTILPALWWWSIMGCYFEIMSDEPKQ